MPSYEDLLEQNALLKYENEQLKKLIYSSKRERYITEQVAPEQGNLFDQEPPNQEVEPITQTIPAHQRKKTSNHKGRKKLPSHLPVQEVVIEPDVDTTDMEKIGEEVTETLDYTPASLIVKRTRRIKYATKAKDGDSDNPQIIIAPRVERPINRCIAESSLLAHIIIKKFIDHMPFYRQIQGFKRDFNWEPSKSTINDWFIAVCTLLDPLYEQLKKELIQSSYIQVDESPIKVQDKSKSGTTHQGYMWVMHDPIKKNVAFTYNKSRSHHAIKDELTEFKGCIQCDGYGAYDKLAQVNENIHLAGCWVHARRKYYESKDSDSSRANKALDIFAEVYKLEREYKEYDPGKRKSYRDKHIVPLINKLYKWIDEESIKVLPKSPIGKAMNYTIQQKSKLMACFSDGVIELDNNYIENKIRPLALGRKNYLFAGSHDAGRRIAMMYSFFATCKANDVNPQKWLTYVLDNIADNKILKLANLLPQNVKM